jgi:PAS domain S-box-containing protein
MERERNIQYYQFEDRVRQHMLRSGGEDEAFPGGVGLNESHLRAVARFIPAGLIVTDARGRCRYANERWLQMAGVTLDEALGDGWVNSLHPDDRERIAAAWYGSVDGGVDWDLEYRFKTPAGKTVWVLGVASTLRDEQGRVTGYIAANFDITQTKDAEEELKTYVAALEASIRARTSELEAAQAQLSRREKLAVLGQLAGSVGHELRNPLSVIYNATYYLQELLDGADDATKDHLRMIAATAREAEAIITDLLDFSRTRASERALVPLESLIDGVLVKHPAPDGIQVALDISPDLPPIWVDAQQIGQVLDNLITNAYQAMDTGGTLTLTARTELEQVQVAVTDTGCGIAPEDQAHIFEPLFTTKTHGIGLGLALSKNYVELNGGTIGFESEPDAGCTFTVSLPVHLYAV